MLKYVSLAGCCVVLLFLSGCQAVSENNGCVEVIVQDGGEFPSALAGTWRADKDGWEIVLEPDGTITSAVISIGRVRMTPGKVTEVPARGGGTGKFVPGDWIVTYTPNKRELEIQLVLEHFRQDMGSNAMEGSSVDIFSGPVSQDNSQWKAEWFTFPTYVMYLGPEKQRHDLPFDAEENPIDTLTFTKVREIDK